MSKRTPKESPVLFSAPMVLAIGDDRKTQTRRIVKPQPNLMPHMEPVRPEPRADGRWVFMTHTDRPSYSWATGDVRSPHGKPGDRLWVRENIVAEIVNSVRGVRYLADGAFRKCGTADQWEKLAAYRGGRLISVPSIHMPRWAARYLLDVADVRIERLQDISEEDAQAEGFASRAEFLAAWAAIYGQQSVAAKPWVWVTTFKRALAAAK